MAGAFLSDFELVLQADGGGAQHRTTSASGRNATAQMDDAPDADYRDGNTVVGMVVGAVVGTSNTCG